MSVEYRPFDWELHESQRNPQVVAWLRKNHNQAVTEEEFIAAMRGFKQYTKGSKRKYSPSHLRQAYHHLKNRFGFFHEQGCAPAPTA